MLLTWGTEQHARWNADEWNTETLAQGHVCVVVVVNLTNT